MAINVGQRHISDTVSTKMCYAVDKCQHLCSYVLCITKNKKVLENPQADLAWRVRAIALDIHSLVSVANRIDTRTEDEEQITARLENQKAAYYKLLEMLSLIPVVSAAYGWRSKRRRYWTELVESAINLVKAWHTADKNKFN